MVLGCSFYVDRRALLKLWCEQLQWAKWWTVWSLSANCCWSYPGSWWWLLLSVWSLFPSAIWLTLRYVQIIRETKYAQRRHQTFQSCNDRAHSTHQIIIKCSVGWGKCERECRNRSLNNMELYGGKVSTISALALTRSLNSMALNGEKVSACAKIALTKISLTFRSRRHYNSF